MRNRPQSPISATAGVIGRNPREAVGVLAMMAAVSMIFVNALFLQNGPHPAPIFAPRQAVMPAPLSRFMPPQVQSSVPHVPPQAMAVPAPAPRPHIEQGPARGNDPIAALLAPSNRVIAVQQVLTQYGYGQIRPTGVMGPETQDAIRRFERSQRMPVTGAMSDHVVKALAQMSGRSLD